jgi:tetratricopeptide (TPR) repeat protein
MINAFRFPQLLAALLVGCGASTTRQAPATTPAPPRQETLPLQIVTLSTDGTSAELAARGEQAMLRQDYRAAIVALEALRGSACSADVLLDLSLAYEAIREFHKARIILQELSVQYPTSPRAREGVVRQAQLAAYLEDWAALGALGEQVLQFADLTPVERMHGLGARGLSRIEAGSDVAAMHDVQEGLDLVDQEHFGASGRLPVAAAQLRFALAEVRRVRSERIELANRKLQDFLPHLEARCAGLLDAQGAYTDAIRSVNPQWALMSGLRVGEMYRALHVELMKVPPTQAANSDKKRELFYAMMHVRYRVLLEKGVDMMDRTIALGIKLQDGSTWVTRAQSTKLEMEKAIADEKELIKRVPYTEEEIQKGLDLLKQKVAAQQEKAAKAAEARRPQ